MFNEIPMTGEISGQIGCKIESEKRVALGIIVSIYGISLVQKVNTRSRKERVISFDIKRVFCRELGCSGLLEICVPSMYSEKKFMP